MGNQNRDRDHPAPWVPRTSWMVVFVFVSIAAPFLHGFSSLATPADPRRGWSPALFSPISMVFEVTKDRSWMGVTAATLPEHWRAGWITFAGGLALFLASSVLPRPAGVKTLPEQTRRMD